MNTIANVVLTILEALGVVGALTTLLTAMKNQPVITWCNNHGSLLLWYIISTFVFYVIINILKGVAKSSLIPRDIFSSYSAQQWFFTPIEDNFNKEVGYITISLDGSLIILEYDP